MISLLKYLIFARNWALSTSVETTHRPTSRSSRILRMFKESHIVDFSGERTRAGVIIDVLNCGWSRVADVLLKPMYQYGLTGRSSLTVVIVTVSKPCGLRVGYAGYGYGFGLCRPSPTRTLGRVPGYPRRDPSR